MQKISEILRQRHDLKLSYREIAKSLDISLSSIWDYLARARVAGVTWPLPEGCSEEALYAKLFLPVEKGLKRPLPDWEQVNREIRKKGMTLRLLWREYRENHPTGLGYTQFCVQYQHYKKAITPVMRQIHKAGEKCFVDYAGMKMPVVCRRTGEVSEAEIFVGCLGASQYLFVEATASQQLEDWIGSHTRMFEYFGGVSAILVPDNLKSGVSYAHRYDPDVNRNYQHFGEYYGVAIVPARVNAPKDKAKVENAVGCVERQILAPMRHQIFTSLGELNQALRERVRVFNQQSFQKMDASRATLFELLDKPALKPLPEGRYEYAKWKCAKVGIDYHFSHEKHHYSVPYPYIHHEIELRLSEKTIECFYKGTRIATHVRSQIAHAYTTCREHMPAAHDAHARWTPERMRRWANKIGIHTANFIERMIHSRAFPEQAYRACLGVLRLGERYGEVRLEKACLKALRVGAMRYKEFDQYTAGKFLPSQTTKRGPVCCLSDSEIMTILIFFQSSRWRDFKNYYNHFLSFYFKKEFPTLPSYNRFLEIMKRVIFHLVLFAQIRSGKRTGIYYIDSTCLPVCHLKRSKRHKTFEEVAEYGRTSVGWFFGLKLHLIINDRGELIAFKVTSGKQNDAKAGESIMENLKGLLFGDKGYIGKELFSRLLDKGLKLITRGRKNMKEKTYSPFEKQLLDKRGIIETVINHFKHHYQIWHTRHRSIFNAITHLMAGIAAYAIAPLKISAIRLLASNNHLT